MHKSNLNSELIQRKTRGIYKFILYCLLQTVLLILQLPWVIIPMLITIVIIFIDNLAKTKNNILSSSNTKKILFFGISYQLVFISFMPALLALFPLLSTGIIFQSICFWQEYLEPLLKSLRIFFVFVLSSWLSRNITYIDLRDILLILFKPIGKRKALSVSRLASLVIAFLPWTKAEFKKNAEAISLRGLYPKKHPIKYMLSLSSPMLVSLLAKAKHSSEALLLRDYEAWK